MLNPGRAHKLHYWFCAIVFTAMACGLSPQPTPTPTFTIPGSTPTLPSSTPENIRPADTPRPTGTSVPEPTQTEPKPVVTITPVSLQDFATDTSDTDSQGRSSFSDPLNGQSITLKVADTATNQPIEGIAVTFVSNGPEVLIIAVDPLGIYTPNIIELKYSELGFASQPNSVKLASLSRQSLEVVLFLIAVIEFEQNFKDWWAYAQDLPDLDRWGFMSQDYCVSNDQTSNYLKASIGSALILFPPFKNAFITYADDILVTFLTTIGDTELGNLITSQIEKLGLIFRPAITKWRVYQIGGGFTYLPARPVGWCLEPLDRKNPQNIINWVRYGMDHDDLYPFKVLVTESAVGYVFYIEGGQTTSKEEFLADLQDRFASNPHCDGYYIYDNVLHIWTSGWTPNWEMVEMCYVGCETIDPPYESSIASFFFYPSDKGYKLNAVWLNDIGLWEEVYHVKLVDCDQPYNSQDFTIPTPTQSASPLQCPGAPSSRLKVGEYAYVSTNPPLANRVRNGPGKSYDVIGKIQPGKVMEILEGPRCADNWAWWKVRELDTGLVGWTSEGDNQNYWLIPCEDAQNCGPH